MAQPIRKVVVGGDCYGADHAKDLAKLLIDAGYDVEFFAYREGNRYADVAKRVAQRVMADKGDARGAVICGTGLGIAAGGGKMGRTMSVGPIRNEFAAKSAALSNHADMISFAAFDTGKDDPTDIQNIFGCVKVFLDNAHLWDPTSNSAANVAAVLELGDKYGGLSSDEVLGE